MTYLINSRLYSMQNLQKLYYFNFSDKLEEYLTNLNYLLAWHPYAGFYYISLIIFQHVLLRVRGHKTIAAGFSRLDWWVFFSLCTVRLFSHWSVKFLFRDREETIDVWDLDITCNTLGRESKNTGENISHSK